MFLSVESMRWGRSEEATLVCSVSHGAISDRNICVASRRQREPEADHHCDTQQSTSLENSLLKQSMENILETHNDSRSRQSFPS